MTFDHYTTEVDLKVLNYILRSGGSLFPTDWPLALCIDRWSQFAKRPINLRGRSGSRYFTLGNVIFGPSALGPKREYLRYMYAVLRVRYFAHLRIHVLMKLSMSIQASPFPFLELIECLKTTRRSGWVRRGVPGPTESVADHMYRMAIMCRMTPGVYF